MRENVVTYKMEYMRFFITETITACASSMYYTTILCIHDGFTNINT